MKNSLVWLVVINSILQAAAAQSGPTKNYRNFPIVLSVQFHSLSFPFKDLRTNFKNVGFGIGSEIALGSKHDWAQQFQLVWYRNKQAGNGIVLYTQSAWRPTIMGHVYTEIKAGFGVTYNFRPVVSYKQTNDGWQTAGHAGKWLFTLPVGVSLGYHDYSRFAYAAPFISYQILANANYAKSVPAITNSLIQVGTGLHLSNNK